MGITKTKKTVAVTGPGGGPVTVEIQPIESLRVTTLDITDVATLLPTAAFTGRRALAIVNKDVAEILYLGNATVTADTVVGTTSGWEVNPQEAFNADIDDVLVLYGIAPAGKTIRVKILELA